MSLLRDYTNSLTSLSADINWQKMVTQRSTFNLVGLNPRDPTKGLAWDGGLEDFFGSEIWTLREFLVL